MNKRSSCVKYLENYCSSQPFLKMTESEILNESFQLPCGVIIPNRIVKSAMSENDADTGGRPSDAIITLYETWGKGGAGILISGNVMIDSSALGEAKKCCYRK